MVSIIVPVYETERYLPQCIDSIIGQTYRDIEILLVVAKSKDKSEQICESYAAKDSRIRIVRQTGKGAGDARNIGVYESKGDFICFVDSDDWIKPGFVEKLLEEMVSHELDVVECDYSYGENGDERCGGNSVYESIDINLMIDYGAPAIWKLMYRRDFWEKEEFGFTNTIAEDLYLYTDVYRVCKRRAFVKTSLYCYRIRSESMTNTDRKLIRKYTELLSLFKMLVDRYKERGLFDRFSGNMYRQLTQHAGVHFRSLASGISLDEIEELRNSSADFFATIFDKPINSFNSEIVVLGGYNLGRISNLISPEPIKKIRYSFSSIISIMSDKSTGICVTHDNDYRQCMLDKDIRGAFLKVLTGNSPDILILDMVEERYDIIDVDGYYYTDSDAFEESQSNIQVRKNIYRMSEECDELWERSCDRFVDVIEKLDNKCRIILVENYLSYHVGNIYTRRHVSDDRVASLNAKLGKYYHYLEDKCGRLEIIKWDDIPDTLKYTDEAFEHGVKPEHLNQYYYGYVANKIFDYLAE